MMPWLDVSEQEALNRFRGGQVAGFVQNRFASSG